MISTARAWRRFWIDAELRRVLCERLRLGAEGCIVDCTPPSAERSGVFWCALGGGRAAFGMIPVSDGTELVLEVHPDRLTEVRERIRPKVRRSLRECLDVFAKRLEAIGE